MRSRRRSYVRRRKRKVTKSERLSQGTLMRYSGINVQSNPVPTGGGTGLQMGQLILAGCVYPTANERQGKPFMHVKSINIHRHFWYDAGVGQGGDIGPIMVRWALVQMKALPGGATSQAATAVTVIANEFWEQRVGLATTFRGFVNYPAAATSWDAIYNVGKINRDAQIRVLATRSKILLPRSADSQVAGKDRWVLKKQFMINKKLSYSTAINSEPDEMFYEIYWYNAQSPIVFPSANPTAVQYVRTINQSGIAWKEVG